MRDFPHNEIGGAIGLENSNFDKTYGSSLKETASSRHQQPDCRKRIFYGPPHIASENTNLQRTNRDTTQYNYLIGATHQFNRCHPPIQSVPPTNPNPSQTPQNTQTPIQSVPPTNLRIHPKGWFYGIHLAGSGFACVGELGSPVISPSQSSAPLELRPSIIGATHLLNRCHPPISTHARRRKTPKHPSNRCRPPIQSVPPTNGTVRVVFSRKFSSGWKGNFLNFPHPW
jgi:hypothetical protein